MKILVCFTLFLWNTVQAQFVKSSLLMRNGDTIQGYSVVYSGESNFYFKTDLSLKKDEKYTYKKVKRVVQDLDSIKRVFEFKIIAVGGGKPKIVELVTPGKFYLYKKESTLDSNFGGGLNMSSNFTHYYIFKDNADVFTDYGDGSLLGGGRKFRKKATKVFKDCLFVVEKIKNKIWKSKDIPEIIMYYNSVCHKN